jgi:hypothetical protein
MLKQGGYYKAVQKIDSIPAGTLVYLIQFTEEEVQVYKSGRTTYTFSMDEFLSGFDYEPNGAEILNNKLETLVKSLNHVEFDPKILASDLQPEEIQISECTDLAQVDQFKLKKQQMSLVRAKMDKFQNEIEKRQEEINSLLEDKKRILEYHLEKFTEMSSTLTEAIWTLNLYAGVNEQIVQLKKGEPCPATEKVRIRQNLLFMDEECAVAADKGGIDFQNIEEFDKWVIKPKHLAQVLPEKKGVVALRVRRSSKDYDPHPWVNAEMNKPNFVTYFLIRNGDNIYRIYSDIVVHEVLFPRRNEFDAFFKDINSVYRPGEHRFHEVEEEIKPGSIKFMKAMKDCDKEKRHFYRILLILQGLFDRTQVFAPIEGDRVNVLDRREYNDTFEFIYDAEMLLPDGRERFWDWVERVNGELQVGHRIVGEFHSYGSSFSRKDRVKPDTAETPDAHELYTIERREGEGFVFLYKRSERIWRRYDPWSDKDNDGPAKVRASCLVYADDRFIINIDAVTLDEVEFYLESRLDRHNYIQMFPLLEVVKKIKKKEAEEEAPFIKLLTGKLITGFKISTKKAEEEVVRLIKWWKYKNKTHRALCSNDELALKQIIQEYDLRDRHRIEVESRTQYNARIVDQIQSLVKDVLLIAHKKNNEYVSFSAMNGENVFAREILWKFNGNTGELRNVEDKTWKIIDTRYERWIPLFKTERFENWEINRRMSEVLTDPEREDAIDAAMLEIRKFDDKEDKHHDHANALLLTATIYYTGTIRVFYMADTFVYDTKKFLTGEFHEPYNNYVTVKWKRVDGKPQYDVNKYPNSVCGEYWDSQWEHGKVFYRNEKNLAIVAAERAKYEAAKKVHRRYSNYCSKLTDCLEDELRRIHEQELFKRFSEDNHPSLWKDSKERKKAMEAYRPDTTGINNRIEYLVERGIDVNHAQLKFILEESTRLGFKFRRRRDSFGREFGPSIEDEKKMVESVSPDFVLETDYDPTIVEEDSGD